MWKICSWEIFFKNLCYHQFLKISWIFMILTYIIPTNHRQIGLYQRFLSYLVTFCCPPIFDSFHKTIVQDFPKCCKILFSHRNHNDIWNTNHYRKHKKKRQNNIHYVRTFIVFWLFLVIFDAISLHVLHLFIYFFFGGVSWIVYCRLTPPPYSGHSR